MENRRFGVGVVGFGPAVGGAVWLARKWSVLKKNYIRKWLVLDELDFPGKSWCRLRVLGGGWWPLEGWRLREMLRERNASFRRETNQMNQTCFDYLFISMIAAKYKKFSIQQRRTRTIHFCVIVDREFKFFGGTTLIKIAKVSKINLK